MAGSEKYPEIYIMYLVIIKTLTEKMLPGYPLLKRLAVLLSEQNPFVSEQESVYWQPKLRFVSSYLFCLGHVDLARVNPEVLKFICLKLS